MTTVRSAFTKWFQFSNILGFFVWISTSFWFRWECWTTTKAAFSSVADSVVDSLLFFRSLSSCPSFVVLALVNTCLMLAHHFPSTFSLFIPSKQVCLPQWCSPMNSIIGSCCTWISTTSLVSHLHQAYLQHVTKPCLHSSSLGCSWNSACRQRCLPELPFKLL